MNDIVKIGIDLGGSHVAIGVIDNNNKIIEQFEKDFTVEEKKNLMEVATTYIIEIINKLKTEVKYNFSKIGIGIPGTISKGIILKSVNLGIENYNIKKILEKATGCKVKVKNDAKCAMIAEFKLGECKKYKNVLFMTLGTGIGGGFIYNGKILEGNQYEGLEFGHMVIKSNGVLCKCGRKGCFERYGSILVFKKQIIERLNLSPNISGPELREKMSENKEKIEDIIESYIKNLAIGISNLVNIFEPDCVVIGGGFARYDYILLDKLKAEILKGNYLFNSRKDIDIQVAGLGNDAGIIGASEI